MTFFSNIFLVGTFLIIFYFFLIFRCISLWRNCLKCLLRQCLLHSQIIIWKSTIIYSLQFPSVKICILLVWYSQNQHDFPKTFNQHLATINLRKSVVFVGFLSINFAEIQQHAYWLWTVESWRSSVKFVTKFVDLLPLQIRQVSWIFVCLRKLCSLH